MNWYMVGGGVLVFLIAVGILVRKMADRFDNTDRD